MDTNLTAALVALQNSMDRKVVELRGETGERGLPGAIGATGPAGKDAKLKIGIVVSGEKPEARIRESGDNTFILDLCLPRGEQGDRGFLGLPGKDGIGKDGRDGESVVGPAGRPGRDGVDAAPLSQQDVEKAVRKILEQNPEKFRGSAGESVIGSKGERGEPGMTREEIGQTIIEVLSNAGVITEQAKKLISVKAALRTALNKATSRSQAEMQDLVRKVDEILE